MGRRIAVFAALLTFVCGAVGVAAEITLAWDPNREPDLAAVITLTWDPNGEPDLAGYRIYYGSASGTYSSVITVAIRTTYIFSNLPPGTYYFAITAFNTANLESGYSNEVSTIIPLTLSPATRAPLIPESPNPVDSDPRNYRRQLPELPPGSPIPPPESEIGINSVAPEPTLPNPLNPAQQPEINLAGEDPITFALTNLGTQPAIVLVTAYDSSGSALAGDGILNPLVRPLEGGAQIQVRAGNRDSTAVCRESDVSWLKGEAFDIGFALVNPGMEEVEVRVDFYDRDGSVAYTGAIDVAPGECISQLLMKFSSEYIRITSNVPENMARPPSATKRSPQ